VAENVEKMKPIWFFVGLVLVVMGGVILISGLYDLFARVESKTVLSHLRPGIWWGGLMVGAGLIFILANKNVTVD
jgi:hypothetical protein